VLLGLLVVNAAAPLKRGGSDDGPAAELDDVAGGRSGGAV
jgi:hypothetical protein